MTRWESLAFALLVAVLLAVMGYCIWFDLTFTVYPVLQDDGTILFRFEESPT